MTRVEQFLESYFAEQNLDQYDNQDVLFNKMDVMLFANAYAQEVLKSQLKCL